MTNAEIARALVELALHLEMDEVPFKPRAFEKAAQAVEAEARPLLRLHQEGGLKALLTILGIGKGSAERIAELLTKGQMDELERLREKTPVDLLDLTSVEGLGPKKVKALHLALGIRTLDDLEAAARAGRIQGLPHFQARSEEKILHAIELRRRHAGRKQIGEVYDLAREIEARLAALPGVERAVLAGSLRRRKETIGDLDFLVVSSGPEAVMAAFIAMPEVAEVDASGETKTTVKLKAGLDADLRVVEAGSFGAALNYFTGSKAHNIALRRLAMARGWKLSEYGLFEGDRQVAGATEDEIYEALGLEPVPPELREDQGEIEQAAERRLPRLVGYGEIKGDLQVQTDWTDGKASIEAMAKAAFAYGLEYLAITDHTRDLAMTRGSDEAKLLEQAEEIRRVERALGGRIRVLTGAEVNIRKDGTLDIADEALAKLDVVGAAVHSHFQLGRDEMTARVVRAIENPNVDILFHPTSRSPGVREAIDLDLDQVFAAALRTGTVLEVDAQPGRLDLRDEHVRRALAQGVKLVIDSDAHHPREFRFLDEYGVAVARRGWARKEDVLNTLPVDAFLAALKGGRART